MNLETALSLMVIDKPSQPAVNPRVTQHHLFRDGEYVFYPYELNGCIVFDDPKVGLKAEEFVCGADTLIREMVRQDAQGADDYHICVSAEPLGTYRCLRHIGPKDGGEVYECEEMDHAAAWFCPSFYHYFPTPPPFLYVRAFGSRRIGTK